MKPILEVQNISKQYRIQHLSGGYLSLRERLLSALKFEKNETEDFLALNDVSFEVQPGESIGIIGRNGAGKSTLLKILSRITPPTKGKIITRGRVASLLEVGTGFHPELSGRENIFFNGSLLGMKRREIETKFDEIVDFSGTEKFLDTPLKHYSSGMQLRLAFSVAAFLEPEILIIDEVLAVGDAEFQKKCLGKMEDVSKHGRTILFVSHNMAAVQSLCSRALLMNSGSVHKDGEVKDVILDYYLSAQVDNTIKIFDNKQTYVSGFSAVSENDSVYTLKSTKLTVEVTSRVPRENVFIGFGINDVLGTRLFTVFSKHINKKFNVFTGKNVFECTIEKFPLKPGIYAVEIYVGDGTTVFDYYNHGLNIEILPSENIGYESMPDESQGSFIVNQLWG